MTQEAPIYGDGFFALHEQGSDRSAARVVPEVLRLVAPRSVIDVGCGIGFWAAEFEKHGIPDVLGVDGPYVSPERLRIRPERFMVRDLTKPLGIARRFDLAVSLEVAEHLPESCSGQFIGDLCALAPVVLFSAAIPLQAGTFHVNEQWPGYWERIFRKHNYVALDCLRHRVWNDDSVEWWYRQNTILYASAEFVERHSVLGQIAAEQPERVVRMVHPRLYEEKCNAALHPGLRTVLRNLPPALMRTVRKVLRVC